MILKLNESSLNFSNRAIEPWSMYTHSLTHTIRAYERRVYGECLRDTSLADAVTATLVHAQHLIIILPDLATYRVGRREWLLAGEWEL